MVMLKWTQQTAKKEYVGLNETDSCEMSIPYNFQRNMRKMLFIFWSAEFIINLQGMKRNAFLSAVTAYNSYPKNLEACANSVDPDQMPQCGI